MRAIDAGRLTYLHETLSYRAISERTGIPIATISYVIRGERELSPRYRENLRDNYRQQVFTDFRTLGVSQNQATRYTLTSPERARSVLTHASDIKNLYVNQNVISKIASLESQGLDYSMPTLHTMSVETVTRGLEYSDTDPEGWNEEGSI